MIEFRLDARSGIPTYLQLVQQVRQALRLGILQPGDQLPTVREVVTKLAINPNTVLKAYRELDREGLVDGRRGQGTFVAEGVAGSAPSDYSALRSAPSRRMPPRSASESASCSARSAVSETAPSAARTTCSSRSRSLSRSAMRPRLTALATPFPLRLRARDCALDGRNGRERRSRLGCGGVLGLLERRLAGRGLHVDVPPPRELRLAFLPDRQQRRRDEDRRVRARGDSDEQREREVLQRRAAEEEQR